MGEGSKVVCEGIRGTEKTREERGRPKVRKWGSRTSIQSIEGGMPQHYLVTDLVRDLSTVSILLTSRGIMHLMPTHGPLPCFIPALPPPHALHTNRLAHAHAFVFARARYCFQRTCPRIFFLTHFAFPTRINCMHAFVNPAFFLRIPALSNVL